MNRKFCQVDATKFGLKKTPRIFLIKQYISHQTVLISAVFFHKLGYPNLQQMMDRKVSLEAFEIRESFFLNV